MGKNARLTLMIWRALSTEALVSNDRWASTSVETLPGMILRISVPNSTRRRSSASSTCSSAEPPLPLAYETALSIRAAYSGFLEAARMREGLVVASWGLYLPMAGGVSVGDLAGDGGPRGGDYDARRTGFVLQAKSPGGSVSKGFFFIIGGASERAYQSR